MRGASLLLALAVSGCSLFGGSSGPKPAELPPLPDAKEVRVRWSASVGSADAYRFEPSLVGDGALYAAARDGTVARLDAASGVERWRVGLERKLSAGVGASDRTAVVATEEGEVIALDTANGQVRWRARVSSEVLATPVVQQGLVFVRSIDSRIFAFAEDDGVRRWVYQRAPASLIVRGAAGLSVAGDTLFAGFSGGRLAAISIANGAARWEAAVAVPRGATELERVADVLGHPAVQGREVCAAAYQGRVACFEAASGRPVWARELPALTGVALDARYAFVVDARGTVHALDRTNGRTVWRQERLAYRQLSRPAPVSGFVALGDFEGYVHFLDRESGAFVARYGMRGGAVRVPPVPLGEGVLVQTLGGDLAVLVP